MPTIETPTLLSDKEVAKILGVSRSCVRMWRRLNRGPKWVQIEGTIRYSHDDLQSWIASRPQGPQQ